MFERITDTARRAVWFARYDASLHGTPEIQPASLLPGIMEVDKNLIVALLPAGADGYARLWADAQALFAKPLQAVPPDTDLPLSRQTRRVLAWADDKAARRPDPRIEPRHLLWGLLHEGGPLAACLNAHGITLETVDAGFPPTACQPDPGFRWSGFRRWIAGRLRPLTKLLVPHD